MIEMLRRQGGEMGFSPQRLVSCAFWAVLCACGLAIALRALWGPFSIGVRVDSPMNVEAIASLAVILALVARSSNEGSDCRSRSDEVAWLPILAICILTAFAYRPATHISFLSDDFVIVRTAGLPSARGLRNLFAVDPGYGFYRPIANLSFALNSILAGVDPVAWHASNLVLHAANSALVYVLATWLVSSRFSAFFAAALFCLHGTRPEAAVWIAGRFDLLATLFVLGGLVLFVRSLQSTSSARRIHGLLAIGCMILAILSKESAYIFPLLAALILWLRRAKPAEQLTVAAPYFLIAAALFGLRWWMFGGIGGYREGGRAEAWAFSLVPALKALVPRTWAVLLFPLNWSSTPGALFALLVASYVFALGWLTTARLDRRKSLFAIGFVMISALPPLHMLLMGSDLTKSRLLYLPSVGFCLLAGVAAEAMRGRSRWVAPGLVLVFHFAALEHNLKIWEYASAKAQSACEAAAGCLGPSTRKIMIKDLPETLRGVYFFGNGLRECIEMKSGASSPRVELLEGEVLSDVGKGLRVLQWDRSAETFRCVEKARVGEK